VQTESSDTLEDVVGILRPAKWLGRLVAARGVDEKSGFQLGDASMYAPQKPASCEEREPRLM